MNMRDQKFSLRLALTASFFALSAGLSGVVHSGAMAQEQELMEPDPSVQEQELMEDLGPVDEDDGELKENLDDGEADSNRSIFGRLPGVGGGGRDKPGDGDKSALVDPDAGVQGSDDGDMVLTPQAVASAAGVTCGDETVCIVDATGQPLRILPRSFAALYKAPGADADVLSDAVSAFKPAFVFDRRGVDLSNPTDPKGWYQVGYSQRSPIGWMKAADVIEWRQALILEYIHPGKGSDRRPPVLMFADKDTLEDVVLGNGRARKVADLQKAIDSGERPEGVIGREPPVFLNIDEQFYVLPIIQWSAEESFDEPSHYLQVFAAVPGERAASAGEGTLEDDELRETNLALASGETLVDVVFVIDMTGSMGRYIDRVKSAVAGLTETISKISGDKVTVRFGLVGYRDSVETTPDLEWTRRNFTPDLVEGAELTGLLDSGDLVASVSSDEWAEDVFGGFEEGLNSSWRSEEGKREVRIMVLIGDASGHEVSDERKREKNSSGKEADDLNALAVQRGIYVWAVYLKDDRAEPEWEKGIDQFSRLARSPDDRSSGALGVFADSAAEADKGIERTTLWLGNKLVGLITSDLETVQDFVEADTDAEAMAEAGGDEETERSIEVARGTLQAAMVDWLGDAAERPRDFVSWVFDQDLSDVNRPALGVRVLVTREQLDNIIRQSETLIDALDNNILGQVDFLTSLKLASAQTSLGLEVDPDLSLGEQEFLPKWVAALPYRSRVLGMTPSEFTNLSASDRMEFRASLESKYSTYRALAGSPDVWTKLDDGDTELQEVTFISLSLLP